MTDDLISRAALLPCPFCGAGAKLYGGPSTQETYSIWCSGTPSHHQDFEFDAEKAITAWNTRAIPAAQVQAEPVDNPSGMACTACRSVGMWHCSDPLNCGNMKPMRHACSCNEPWCKACATPPAPDDLDALAMATNLLAENRTLTDNLAEAREHAKDVESTLDAWFDRKKITREQIGPMMLDAAKGYLRTSRVGGMSQEESDTVEGIIADMIRLDYLTAPVTQYLMTQDVDVQALRQQLAAAETAALVEAARLIRDGFGPNHTSRFCRDVAAQALAAIAQEKQG